MKAVLSKKKKDACEIRHPKENCETFFELTWLFSWHFEMGDFISGNDILAQENFKTELKRKRTATRENTHIQI